LNSKQSYDLYNHIIVVPVKIIWYKSNKNNIDGYIRIANLLFREISTCKRRMSMRLYWYRENQFPFDGDIF